MLCAQTARRSTRKRYLSCKVVTSGNEEVADFFKTSFSTRRRKRRASVSETGQPPRSIMRVEDNSATRPAEVQQDKEPPGETTTCPPSAPVDDDDECVPLDDDHPLSWWAAAIHILSKHPQFFTAKGIVPYLSSLPNFQHKGSTPHATMNRVLHELWRSGVIDMQPSTPHSFALTIRPARKDKPPACVRVGPSSITGAGDGVFATDRLKEGRVLGEYTGELYPISAVPKALQDSEWLVRGRMFAIDASTGSWPRLINTFHDVDVLPTEVEGGKQAVYYVTSRTANCAIFEVDDGRTFLETTKSIAAQAELFVDYGDSYWTFGENLPIHIGISREEAQALSLQEFHDLCWRRS